MSIFFTGMFKFSQARTISLEAVKQNTFALYALETLKNRALILHQANRLEKFPLDEFASGLASMRNWKLDTVRSDNTMVFTLTPINAKITRSFKLEVQLNE
jgi:hypothetical protein